MCEIDNQGMGVYSVLVLDMARYLSVGDSCFIGDYFVQRTDKRYVLVSDTTGLGIAVQVECLEARSEYL